MISQIRSQKEVVLNTRLMLLSEIGVKYVIKCVFVFNNRYVNASYYAAVTVNSLEERENVRVLKAF